MPQEPKPVKTLMSYEELRRTFSEGRQQLLQQQGPITSEMIQRLQDSRKYAHSPISAAQRG